MQLRHFNFLVLPGTFSFTRFPVNKDLSSHNTSSIFVTETKLLIQSNKIHLNRIAKSHTIHVIFFLREKVCQLLLISRNYCKLFHFPYTSHLIKTKNEKYKKWSHFERISSSTKLHNTIVI